MININPIKLYNFLISKNIMYFYHANTVRTSCTLILQKGLLSRGEIERRQLQMTPQSSDEKDKHFNVWNDIFFDVLDLHNYFSRQNFYGPICFKISNKFLLDKNLPNIYITKDNPIYWNNINNGNRYYSSLEEYATEFDHNMRNNRIQSKMFTIHNTNKKIPFKKYLKEIILDDIESINSQLFYQAKNSIETSILNANLNVPLSIRKCNWCYCQSNYKSMIDSELYHLFMP